MSRRVFLFVASLCATLCVGMSRVLRAQDPTARSGAGATIVGHVTDAASRPLGGVQVSVDDRAAAQTSDAGAYRIPNVPAGSHVLTARRLGYTPKSQTIVVPTAGQVSGDFALDATASMLSEVVITGAGTQTTREKLATTINTVDSSLIHRQATPLNIAAALAGTAPGVEVRTQSGEPGAS